MNVRLARALCFSLLAGCGSTGPREEDWIKVKRDDLVLGVEVTGTLKAADSDPLGPPALPNVWEFKIARMGPEGAEVKEGTPVLAFDAAPLEHSLEEKKNARDAAQKEIEKWRSSSTMARRDQEFKLTETEGKLRKATLKAERPSDMAGTIELATARLDQELAQKELDYQQQKSLQMAKQDQTDLAALEAKRDRAQGAIKELEAGIARMEVLAPRPGTLIYATDWRDEKKKVGDNVYRGQAVVEVASLSRMIAHGDIDEVDASKVSVGQPVTFHLEAHPDVEYSGKISAIGSTVQRQVPGSALKVVHLDIALDHTETLTMRPGMRFRGLIEAGRQPKTLLVPTEAVFLTAQGPVAYRRSGRGYLAAPLKLGKRNREFVEVLDGLQEGDRVSREDLARAEGQSG